MSASISIAKEKIKGTITHIDEVNKKEDNIYVCCECGNKLIPVKTEARGKDWHFRHPTSYNINVCRDRALHDYAVQLISNNTAIELPNLGVTSYNYVQKEAWITPSFRSDAMIKFEENDQILHIEVFVTNDISPEKRKEYINNKIQCIRIDLSDKWLKTADKVVIRKSVLNTLTNKSWVYFPQKVITTPETSVIILNEIRRTIKPTITYNPSSLPNLIYSGLMLAAGSIAAYFLFSVQNKKTIKNRIPWKSRKTLTNRKRFKR